MMVDVFDKIKSNEETDDPFIRIPILNNVTSREEFLRVLFTGTYTNSKIGQTWNIIMSSLRDGKGDY